MLATARKAIVAALIAGIMAFLADKGWANETSAEMVKDIVESLVTAAFTGGLTYFVPNRKVEPNVDH